MFRPQETMTKGIRQRKRNGTARRGTARHGTARHGKADAVRCNLFGPLGNGGQLAEKLPSPVLNL